jgi:signal transduction histidine kinase
MAIEQHGHILVVDDERIYRQIFEHSLKQQGYTVALAENGQKALDMMRAESFDVVLLDILMPGMTGFEVLAQMKADQKLRDIPVIVISAEKDTESVARGIEMGADDYLTKPWDDMLLRARLHAGLQWKKLRDLEVAYLRQEVALRQNEKLATLGKLSAGMAHELNNPAAAAQRSADQLRTAVTQLQDAQLRLGALDLSSVQHDMLLSLDRVARERATQPSDMDAIAESDRTSQLEDWLQERGVQSPWEYAPILASMVYTTSDLAALQQVFTSQQLAVAVAWLTQTYTVYSLLEEIAQGTGRIVDLVKALKTYTYLDRAPVQAVDVHEGLDSTLVMLRSKLKGGITVRREYSPDLPRIQAYASELNQVWTNIIDNAADAMEGSGEVVLRTRREGEWVVIEIEDNGPDIPEAIQSKIFDPFFTTKPPGAGTGMGLNISYNIIVHKHGGTISVTSQGGKTTFEIKLPIQLPTAAE